MRKREVVGDHVLDALGLRVHALQRHVQRAMEKGFEQAVPAHHRDRQARPLRLSRSGLAGDGLGLQAGRRPSSSRFALLTETRLTLRYRATAAARTGAPPPSW